MKDKDIKQINDNLPELVESIRIDGLLPRLIQLGTINDTVKANIESNGTEHKKVEALLDEIKKSDKDALDQLHKALCGNGQKWVAETYLKPGNQPSSDISSEGQAAAAAAAAKDSPDIRTEQGRLDVAVVVNKHASDLRSRYDELEGMKDKVSLQETGNAKNMALYINLQIQLGKIELKESRINLRKMKREMNEKIQITTDQIFQIIPNEEKYKKPVRVLTLGRPGIGKSTMLLKVTNDWIVGTSGMKDFKLLYFFRCHELSQLYTEKISVKDLFMHYYFANMSPDEQNIVWEYVKTKPQNIAILIDGLDELGHDMPSDKNVKKDSDELDMGGLIYHLLCGNLLSNICILATSRPQSNLPFEGFHRMMDIYGFDPEGIKTHVEKHCNDDNPKVKFILKYLDKNMDIHSLCSIPVLCLFVVEYLADLYSEAEPYESLPKTRTQLYVKQHNYFLMKHCSKLKHKLADRKAAPKISLTAFSKELYKIGQIANYGLMSKHSKLIISDKELKHEHLSLDENDEIDQAILGSGIMGYCKTDYKCMDETKFFHFIHLTFQEFCTAMNQVKDLEKNMEMKLTKLMKKNREGKLDHVLLFLAGILGDESNMEAALVSIHGSCHSSCPVDGSNCSVSTPNLKEMAKWLIQAVCKNIKSEDELLQSYGSDDNQHGREEHHRDSDDNLSSSSDSEENPSLADVSSDIDDHPDQSDEPDDSDNDDKRRKLLAIMMCYESQMQELTPVVLQAVTVGGKLDLSSFQLSPAECPSIAFVVKSSAILQKLDLSGNQIGNAGISILAKELFKNTKLRDLNLSSNQIGSAGISILAKALSSLNSNLTDLNLSGNKIGLAGAKELLHSTTLRKLYLQANSIDAESLQEALRRRKAQGLPELIVLPQGTNMKEEDKAILIKHGPQLVENLWIDGLITHLMALGVLDQRNAADIEAVKGEGRHAQVERLLVILPTRSDDAFDLFCQAIKNNSQGHLVDEYLKPNSSLITGGGAMATEVPAPSQQDDSVMSKEHEERIRKHSDNITRRMQPERVFRLLWSAGVFTQEDFLTIKALRTNTKKNEKILDILYCKQDRVYQEFIKALEESEQHHIAKFLK